MRTGLTIPANIAAYVDVCLRPIDEAYAAAYVRGDLCRDLCRAVCGPQLGFEPYRHATFGSLEAQQRSADVLRAFSQPTWGSQPGLHQCAVATVCLLYGGWWPVNPKSAGHILEGKQWVLGRASKVPVEAPQNASCAQLSRTALRHTSLLAPAINRHSGAVSRTGKAIGPGFRASLPAEWCWASARGPSASPRARSPPQGQARRASADRLTSGPRPSVPHDSSPHVALLHAGAYDPKEQDTKLPPKSGFLTGDRFQSQELDGKQGTAP